MPGPDPVDADDAETMRAEILRLRDAALGAEATAEVLTDRVAELEAQVEDLAAHNERLQAELGRHPVMRVARALGRRIPGRT